MKHTIKPSYPSRLPRHRAPHLEAQKLLLLGILDLGLVLVNWIAEGGLKPMWAILVHKARRQATNSLLFGLKWLFAVAFEWILQTPAVLHQKRVRAGLLSEG